MDIHSIQLSQLTQIKKYSSEYSNLDENFIFSRITPETLRPQNIPRPMRINGLSMILCLNGSFSVDVNLDHYEVRANSFFSIGPDSIIKFNEVDNEQLDAYVIFISIEFVKDLNIDINALNLTRLSEKHEPVFHMTADEAAILRKYLDLIHINASTNETAIYKRNIARCLMASLIYQMMQFADKRQPTEPIAKSPSASRRVNYVRDFMMLVQKHHCQQRSVSFYASKLFISAKYLSLIIKESTGRSAAEWIDEYVILEAKNLLRYSGKNIQQVAYDLNFTNQSSFGKYFKHLTGMSPSEFQRS